MTDDRKAEEGGLAPWFDAARAETPVPDGDWLARIEAQAMAEQPAARSVAGDGSAVTEPAGRFGLSGLVRLLGGWPAMAGLAAACATGVWIGVAPPDGVADWLPASAADSVSSWGIDPTSGFDDYAVAGL